MLISTAAFNLIKTNLTSHPKRAAKTWDDHLLKNIMAKYSITITMRLDI